MGCLQSYKNKKKRAIKTVPKKIISNATVYARHTRTRLESAEREGGG